MGLLNVDEYRRAISIDSPWAVPAPAAEREVADLVHGLVLRLKSEGLSLPSRFRTHSEMQQLRVLLTIRTPKEMPPSAQRMLDEVLQYQRSVRQETDARELPTVTGWPGVSLWRGDITTLRASAIVNAANAQLLGCFQPLHLCIDNAIHWCAGPRLRHDCAIIMQMQGEPEPTGAAKLTRGYNLPSTYVLHTVGPVVTGGQPTERQRAQLAACYTSCLELASCKQDISTLAFCCISTGVFGYPKRAAVEVALNTVSRWLGSSPSRFERIVFNVFDTEDEAIYLQAMSALRPGQ